VCYHPNQHGVRSGARAQSLSRLEAKANDLATELGVSQTTKEAAKETMLSQGFTAEIPTSSSASSNSDSTNTPSSVILHVEGSQSKEPINVNIYMPGTNNAEKPTLHNTAAAKDREETQRIERALQAQDAKIDKLIQTSQNGMGATQLRLRRAQHASLSRIREKAGRLESLALETQKAEHDGSLAHGQVNEASIQAEIQNTVDQISSQLGTPTLEAKTGLSSSGHKAHSTSRTNTDNMRTVASAGRITQEMSAAKKEKVAGKSVILGKDTSLAALPSTIVSGGIDQVRNALADVDGIIRNASTTKKILCLSCASS
jgi:hypothetical protein